MLKHTKLCTGLIVAFGGLAIAPSLAYAQSDPSLQRVEVTGSRIKRADTEGALPITTIKREELEASGATSVAEFMRTSTFSSAGNFRPQSGSSAQSFAAIDLRGLGSSRTLVLLDGRRLPKAPNVGDSVDLNSIPMAAVERIEILTDGASAIYGSDAIGGVVNIITRKDFEGVAVMAGLTKPGNAGGERTESSALLGVAGEKGRILMGVGTTSRGMVYTRDRPWGQTLGVSSYGNNYMTSEGLKAIGNLKGDPALGCSSGGFWLTPSGTCSFNFNAVAADEAEINTQSFFARGEYKIGQDWKAYLNTSVTAKDSFGRYAPSLGAFSVPANTPNNPTEDDITVYHRTAAAGNRDTTTDEVMKSITAGFQGSISKNVELDFGVSVINSTYKETGRNYLVIPILSQYVADGTYDLFSPFTNAESTLNAIKATIGRDGFFKKQEAFATATVYDMFKLPGGSSSMLFGLERRSEKYADIYDSLSEAGVIGGSAGNSAVGDRSVSAASVELVMPLVKTVEVSLAGRFEKYSDYGSDFAPKASVRWQPAKTLTLRASAGKGFAAPSLPVLHQKEAFSAESVFDPRTCLAFGGSTGGELSAADDCNVGKLVQVDTYIVSNSALKSEKSKQFAFGAVWDPLPWLSAKIDYANIKITDKITYIDAQTLIDRTNGDDPRAIPAGLYVQRDGTGAITKIQAGYANEGTLDASYLDMSVVGKWKSAAAGSFEHELRWSRLLKYDSDGSELKGTLGLPENRATLGNQWHLGDFAAAWNVNYIGSNGTVASRTADSYVTHDIQGTWTILKNTKLVAGVVNLSGKMPKLVAYDGRNFNFYLYDSYGRQPYVRLDHKF
jgi:iron complex outermembrane receptor protein